MGWIWLILFGAVAVFLLGGDLGGLLALFGA